MFLKVLYRSPFRSPLPRLRGGVSLRLPVHFLFSCSSPPTRGCFRARVCKFPRRPLFPAYAGVFLYACSGYRFKSSLPRLRGGVSGEIWRGEFFGVSSPPTRGCFLKADDDLPVSLLFPAYAGVFLPVESDAASVPRLPRASGGVSHEPAVKVSRDGSSPRQRGCFYWKLWLETTEEVFPAPAGVFPAGQNSAGFSICLPRASGGVSRCSAVRLFCFRSSPRQRGCF